MSGAPQTMAHVRVLERSLQAGILAGEVTAGAFQWRFVWQFRRDRLRVEPSLGRALIQEPLGRFLEATDYQLEPGGDYSFPIRARI